MEMYQMKQLMRWFGPGDPVSLSDIRQAGCTGIVTALHQIPNGQVWKVDDIRERLRLANEAGLEWTVVESVPVHEKIKLQAGGFRELIENYKQTIRNLAACGINTITYNFMPVLDWTRTDLSYRLPDGSLALRFHRLSIIAFDLFVLRRSGAEKDYSASERRAAKDYFEQMTTRDREILVRNIIKGLPGSEESFSLEQFAEALKTYAGIDHATLRNHLIYFLQEIIPVAEASGINLAIHPDDPPFDIFGLPRVVSTREDFDAIMQKLPSVHNGICFCTGSLAARSDNDLPSMLRRFGDRIHFLHLRNIRKNDQGDFFEDNHLDGDVDMYAVMEIVVDLMQKRKLNLPMRPDHGHQMLDDLEKKANPGYTAIGRLRGLAELRGLELGIRRNLAQRKEETAKDLARP